LKKNIRLGELRREHNDMLCSKIFLLLLFGIEIEEGGKKDSTWLLFMFHKILRMLYLICVDVNLLSNNRGQLRNMEHKSQE